MELYQTDTNRPAWSRFILHWNEKKKPTYNEILIDHVETVGLLHGFQ